MSKIFSDIVKNAVDQVRSSGAIASISELSGVYTIISSDSVANLNKNEVIELLNTPDYVEPYRILSIDYNANSFTFQADTGKQTGTVGNWKSEAPYFDFGTWKEFLNRLTDKNKKVINNFRKFPYVYLIKGYTYKKIFNRVYDILNVRMYVIDRSDINLYTSEKIESLMGNMQTIKEDLLEHIDQSQNVISEIIETEDILPFAEDFLKGDEYTKMIEIALEPVRILREETNC